MAAFALGDTSSPQTPITVVKRNELEFRKGTRGSFRVYPGALQDIEQAHDPQALAALET
jgi:hypothetical protein